MAEASQLAESLKRPVQWVGTGFILLLLAVIVLAPRHKSYGPHSTMLKTLTIGFAMFQYAQDHEGAYPTGKSSTEVFQKLINENYVTDTDIFYEQALKVPNKTWATTKVLKPENVCWDVTIPMDASSSDFVPVVFSTGYRINYVPGGSATPLFPWAKDWTGIAAFYKGNNVAFLKNDGQPDGVVTNFISQAFNPAGKKYVQLTPDGPLGP